MWSTVPARHPDAVLSVVSDELVLVIDEDGARPLEGRLFPLIVPLVDGRRTAAEIAARLEGRATIADVLVGLDELIRERALAPAAGAATGEPRPADRDPRDPLPPVRHRVAIVDAGGVGTRVAEAFAAVLRRAGVADDPAATLQVVLVDDYTVAALDAINRERLRAGASWLLVKPLGAVPWVGPLFDPAGGGPCWQCLAARLAEAFPLAVYLRRHHPGADIPRFVPSARAAAVERAGEVAARWCGGPAEPSWPATIETIDTRTGEIRAHAVAARPGCPACGGRVRADPPDRTRPPSGDAAPLPPPLSRQVSPIAGIVARVSSSSCGPVHVATADHLFEPELELPESLRRGCRRRTAGSGPTAAAARIGAVAEAVERYSGVYRESDAGPRATYAALGASAIHPNAVMGFSAAQLSDRAAWNARHPSRPTRVADPFDEDRPCAWTALRRLGSDDVRWLPTALCYYGARPEEERRACLADSNGCAAGETFDAAVVRAFLELVERDAVGIWWYNRVRRSGVDLGSVPDPFVHAVAAHYARIDRTLRVLDITTDLDVPVFAALSSDADGGRLTIGFGADFRPLSALRHALLEQGLFLPELRAGRRRALFSGPEPRGPYLEPVDARPWRVPAESGRRGRRAPRVRERRAHPDSRERARPRRLRPRSDPRRRRRAGRARDRSRTAALLGAVRARPALFGSPANGLAGGADRGVRSEPVADTRLSRARALDNRPTRL